MPPSYSFRRKPRKRRYFRMFLVTLLIGAAIFFLQKVILTRVVGKILPLAAASANLDLQWNHLHVGFFVPLTMEGVQIRAAASGDETSVRIQKVALDFSNLWSWWKGRGRLFSDIQLEGMEGVLDLRSSAHNALGSIFKDRPQYQLIMFPWALKIQAPDLNLLFDGVTYRVHNFSANLSEDFLGTIQYSFAKIETPIFEKPLPEASALATWKAGTLGIVHWTLLPNCTVDLMNLYFLAPDGLGIDLVMAAFSGSIKGSLTMKSHEVHPYWDAAFVAQRTELNQLAKVLNIGEPVHGILKEGKLTFRGQPGKFSDAEVSVHVSAENFRWNELGWRNLELGADLINHRIAIPEFRLRQDENFLTLNGSAAIPKSIRELSKMPFEVSLVGNIQNLEALAGLLGPKFQHLHGRMTLDGSLWSGKEGPNGYFKLEASSIRFRQAHFTSARLNAIFRDGNIDVTSCELWNCQDFLLAHGSMDLNAPSYQYSAGISLRTSDIALYRSLLGEDWQKQLQSGSIQLTWQGDGNLHRHSGAFNVQTNRLISKWTPAGINGNFQGTFSPSYLSFDRFELLQGPLKLIAQMSASPSGVKVSDLGVYKDSTKVFEATGFMPLDLFAIGGGSSYKAAWRPGKPLFFELNSKNLELAELCRLTGQGVSLEGVIQSHFSLTENSEVPNLSGQLLAEKLKINWAPLELPASKLQMDLKTVHNNVVTAATLSSVRLGELKANISLPVNSGKASFTRFFNSLALFQGNLSGEKINLSVLKSFFPGVNQLTGTGKANISFSNTLSDPKLNGQLVVKNGILEFAPGTPLFSNLELIANIRNNQMSLNNCQGELGQGAFFVRGGADFSNWKNPRYNFQFLGNKLLLFQTPDLTIQSNVHLFTQGDVGSGKISGTIRLQDSELRRHIAVERFCASEAQSSGACCIWEYHFPLPFAAWNLDVSISNDQPLLLRDRLTRGEIVSRLHLGGTLSKVVPAGAIEFKNLRAFFPFAVAEVPAGRVFFDPKYPQDPLLDAQGFVELTNYTLQITATGPLSHPSLFFVSDPQLSQQRISQLLFTGSAAWSKGLEFETFFYRSRFLCSLLDPITKYSRLVPEPKYEIHMPESFLMYGHTLYDLPGTSSEYCLKLVRYSEERIK